jgi:hypothetical protein
MRHAGLVAQADACRLVIRKEKGLSEISQFVVGGLEIGQQVVVLAGPACLKEVARNLGDHGLRPDALLHSGRLVFLTAPNCLAEILKPGELLQRGPLHRSGPVLRWVSDWSWAYANGSDPALIREYQRRVHEFIRPLNAISMCTVHCEKLARTSLLAMLVDHRRTARTVEPARRAA